MAGLLAFNKWPTDGIKVEDPGLTRYISVEAKIMPRNFGRLASKRFYKARAFIVERLINKIYIPGHRSKKHLRSSGHCTGMSAQGYRIVLTALQLLEKQTTQNPIQILVKAIENAAPREEIVAIEYGGARYPKAVDCAPSRRVDIALRNMIHGAYEKSFNKKPKIENALADEILAAFRMDGRSYALSKKLELERQADASR